MPRSRSATRRDTSCRAGRFYSRFPALDGPFDGREPLALLDLAHGGLEIADGRSGVIEPDDGQPFGATRSDPACSAPGRSELEAAGVAEVPLEVDQSAETKEGRDLVFAVEGAEHAGEVAR